MMLRLTGGGGTTPTVEEEKGYLGQSRTRGDTMADVRDIVGAIVGAGQTSGEGLAARYQALRKHLGDAKANKLINHLMVYNQRDDVQGVQPEKRVQQLYDMGSSDEELKNLFGELKSIGYGVVPGFRNSKVLTSQLLSGRTGNTTAALDEEAAKKILLKVSKKM